MSCCTESAKLRDSFLITFTFTDEDGDPLTPTSLTWSLYDDRELIVNEREDVTISSTAGVVNVVLSGNDLDVNTTHPTRSRKVILEGTYNSTYGNDLAIREVACFEIAEDCC